MIDLQKEEQTKTRCLLIGKPKADLAELKGLIDTLGMEASEDVVLTRLEQSPAYGMGTGKAEELCNLAKEKQIDLIVFDWELEPRKQRNWEKLAKIPVIDRQEVILRIFAQRAQTKEAVLQVELARLQYSLPRLAHMYGDMARQRGGNYGSKGAGETQLELDQRQTREKIQQLRKELQQVEKTRETQRKQREKGKVPTVALVGYTNAGKSSLLNSLTGAEVFVEDKLFATLDPTTRRLDLKDGAGILLTDTVGFISALPHSLVDAFKSTLEEAQRADLLLIVLDTSDDNVLFQYNTVINVLREIGAENSRKLIVLNKTDKLESTDVKLNTLMDNFPDCIQVSAKTQSGFEDLIQKIMQELFGQDTDYEIPFDKADCINSIRGSGAIIDEQWTDTTVKLTIRNGVISKNAKLIAILEPFKVI